MHPFFPPPPSSTPTQNHQPNGAPQGPPPPFPHHQFPFQPNLNPNTNNNFGMGMNPMLGFNQAFQVVAAMQLLNQMQQQQQGQQMVHNNMNFLGAGQLFANNLVQGFNHMVHNNSNNSNNNNNPILPPFANNMVQMNHANTSNTGQNYNNNHTNNSTQNNISQPRFQNNNQFNHPNNQNKFTGARGRGRGRGMQFGRGQGNWREGKMDPKPSSDSSPLFSSEKRKKKLPLIIYDPKEIKDWREARKRNFPTTTNIEKKLAKSENEAELRRQQMKEILAKQEELGFEAAEVPTHYLNESKNKTRYDSNKNTQISNRFNNKRGRFGGRGRGRNSNNNNNYRNAPRNNSNYNRRDFESKTEEPSLLKKLLNAEIKADKQRILHALKFMVLNEFFEDFLGGNKELEFPEIRVNGEEKIEEDLEELLSDELLEHESENEKDEKPEEGEITD